jgi:hypothetical protein
MTMVHLLTCLYALSCLFFLSFVGIGCEGVQ